MKTVILDIKQRWLSTLIWAIVLSAFTLIALVEHQVFEISGPAVSDFLESFPPILKAMFGMNNVNLIEFDGYYSMIALYILVMMSVHGAFLGISLLSQEEVDGSTDFILSKPISRESFVFRKIVAGVIIILFIQIVLFISQVLYSQERLMLLSNYSALYIVTHLLMMGVGMAAYALFKDKGDKVALGVIFLMYLGPIISEMTESLKGFKKYSLFSWFNEFDMNLLDKNIFLVLIGLMIVFIVLLMVAMNKTKNKDIL